jgi:CMP-N-acetylneuraminic acid synthetase
MKKIITITFMRKGSKRFPNKMLALLDGKPLYQYTAMHALVLGYEYHLFHDFDHLDLPEFVHEHKRLPEFAGDKHRTNEEILNSGLDADYYIFLQATSPIRDLALLQKQIESFVAKPDMEVAHTVCRLDPGYYYTQKGQRINFKQEARTDNGCEKDFLFKETGGFFMFKKCQLFKKHILDSDKRMMFYTPFENDIDFPADLKKAERILKGIA